MLLQWRPLDRSAIASARSRRFSRGSSIRRASCASRLRKCSSAFGIVELPGAAGDALRNAQNEYIVSLDTFPDSASNHAAKGWLEAERGNVIVARDALNKATSVEPNYAFPWVVKGVLLAREGKFRRGGGDVEEGPIDRAFLPQHRSAHC